MAKLCGVYGTQANTPMKGGEVHASLQELRWLEEAKAGSPEAFDRLVERYERSVYAFVLSRTRNRELSQELVQESFVRAFEGLERFDQGQQFIQWLLGIAHHVTTEWQRKQKLHGRALEVVADLQRARVPADVQGEGQAAAGSLQDRILSAIADCPEPYRLPLTMRYLDGSTYEEIAEVLHLSPGQVKGQLYRGKQMLRERLADLFPSG